MPKVDVSQLVVLKTFLFIGDKSMPPNMSQKLGPLGLNQKQVMEQINKQGKDWMGARVYIEIHAQNRKAEVFIKPGTSAYLLKEVGIEARDRKKQQMETKKGGNLTFDQILKVARLMELENKSRSKEFIGTVKQVLGTCLSIGVTVDGQSPKEITKLV